MTIRTIPVMGITLPYTSKTLTKGTSYTLVPTIAPSNATNKAITWESNNTSVATVDQNGKVTAIAGGDATITATAADGSYLSAMCTVEVTKTNVTIMKDDYDPGYTMVQFEDGRIWRCVNMICYIMTRERWQKT